MLVVSLFLGASCFAACDKGCSDWEGVCACDAPKATVGEPDPSSFASDEKPSKHPEPAYQRGEVHVVDVPNMAADDIKQDQERNEADIVGKKAAGITK